jgi:hypothetical protein
MRLVVADTNPIFYLLSVGHRTIAATVWEGICSQMLYRQKIMYELLNRQKGD